MGKAVKKKNKVKPKEKKEVKKEKKQVSKKGVRGIVRIAGADVFGEIPLNRAILKIKGISHSSGAGVARIVARELKIPMNTEMADLNESQLNKLDDILGNLAKYLPNYLLNRRKDPNKGEDRHVITNDLIFANRQDIEKEKKIYSWRGYRHAYGKKVRGQRTKNTGRHGGALGVVRKSQQQTQKKSPAKGKK